MTTVMPSIATHQNISPHSLSSPKRKMESQSESAMETTPKKPQHKHPKLMAQQSAAKVKAQSQSLPEALSKEEISIHRKFRRVQSITILNTISFYTL
jgi:hypothetical protein